MHAYNAAGIDIGSAISDLYAPLPHYRFNYMLQKGGAQSFLQPPIHRPPGNQGDTGEPAH